MGFALSPATPGEAGGGVGEALPGGEEFRLYERAMWLG
jgi:hypothetical protein